MNFVLTGVDEREEISFIYEMGIIYINADWSNAMHYPAAGKCVKQ